MDYIKHEEVKHQLQIKALNGIIVKQAYVIGELRNFCAWDEIAHENFIEKLKDSDLTVEELNEVRETQDFDEKMHGVSKYYRNFQKLAP